MNFYAANDNKMGLKERHDFLVAQRDKHLAQFTEFNGKGVFLVLTLIFTIFLGIDKVRGMTEVNCGFILTAIAMVAAAGLLGYGAFRMSSFHTDRIRRIEQRLAAIGGEGETTALKIEEDDYRVVNTVGVHTCIFAGVSLIAVVAVTTFLNAMVTPKDSSKAAPTPQVQADEQPASKPQAPLVEQPTPQP